MNKITRKLSCNGCHACYSICPVSAITMISDLEGFLYPCVDEGTCRHCNQCVRVCPASKDQTPKRHTARNLPAAFSCVNLDEDVRMRSSSGGVFSLLAQRIIKDGGVVFGAKFDSEFSVIHSHAETEEGIAAFRGSKYVQSLIGRTYIEAKKMLDSGRKVLFSGTPCQIGGLLSFLGEGYPNLFCVDLVCHGVPSPSLWRQYVRYREGKCRGKVSRIAFRDKRLGWKLYSISFQFENNTEYSESLKRDPYMQLFMSDVCLRESCYRCRFKGHHRQSDLTIADLWGAESIIPEMFDNKGTSLVFVNSFNGAKLLGMVSELMVSQQIDTELVTRYNRSMLSSATRPKARDRILRGVGTGSFSKLRMYVMARKVKTSLRRGISALKGNSHGNAPL